MTNAKKALLAAAPTISKASDGIVRLTINDRLSRSRFVVSIDPTEFAEALFGLAEQPCTLEVPILDRVGKQRVVEQRSVVYDGPDENDRTQLEAWLVAGCYEAGWTIDPSLRSQDSIGRRSDGKRILRYRVFKYVQPAADAAPADAKEEPGAGRDFDITRDFRSVISNEQLAELEASMPGGKDGWLKQWGCHQLAAAALSRFGMGDAYAATREDLLALRRQNDNLCATVEDLRSRNANQADTIIRMVADARTHEAETDQLHGTISKLARELLPYGVAVALTADGKVVIARSNGT